jgi:hypothetical protein
VSFVGGADVKASAVALEGTKWKTVTVPALKKYRGFDTNLSDVSCKSASNCLVIGSYSHENYETAKIVSGPYMLSWNGSALAVIPVPPVPGGDTLESIDAVSCVAVKSCVAFGTAANPDRGYGDELAWTWNGSTWAAKGTAFPARWGDVTVASADCFSLTSCEVGGSSGTDTSRVLLASWNGRKFTAQRMPAGFADSQGGSVADVTCASPGSCAAVGGFYSVDSTSSWSFLAVWNGKTWTPPTKWTAPRYGSSHLNGVSCAAAASCVAVGYSATNGVQNEGAVSFIWNGTQWRRAGVPGIGPGLSAGFDDVSCPRANRCVAAGEYDNDVSPLWWPLAGYWNGRSWKLTGA